MAALELAPLVIHEMNKSHSDLDPKGLMGVGWEWESAPEGKVEPGIWEVRNWV